MSHSPHLLFPFAAVVGQDALKQALQLCAIDPTLGGLLIRGDKGTAKSTAARGLVQVLPPIPRLLQVDYHTGQTRESASEYDPVPFVNLPLGATEDRVLGSLDFEKALKEGLQAFKPGLLAEAHRGVLYIDEVNLLADHLVDVLLDVSAMGMNTVQREGLSVKHPARITLVGTMNQEEGELRPQLLDRFGLMVDVIAPRDPAVRTEVVKRRLAFEADPAGFIQQWQNATDTLRQQVIAARALLPGVTLSDHLCHFISELCCEFEVASLRADIVMHKAARAIAALAGRQQVTAMDIRTAAEFVLPHRRRRKPFEQPGLDHDKLDELTEKAANPPPPPPPPNAGEPESAGEQTEEQAGDNAAPPSAGQQVFAASTVGSISRIEVQSLQARDSSGKRSSNSQSQRGHYVQAVASEQPAQLAVDATLRHALLRNPQDFSITRADLHEKVREGKHANLIVLVVDASGSMAARKRMEMVKGTVLALLQDAYQRRDQVAVISFRGTEAQLLLPPTRQVEQADAALRDMPTGGRTPLAHALQQAAQLLQRAADNLTPLLVVLSDGRANVATDTGSDPWQQALAFADVLAGTPALVLDTEEGMVRLGRARVLAEQLQADYLPLNDFSAEALTMTIRERLR